MADIIKCAHCGKELKVAAEMAGKRVRCPSCKEIMSVPAATAVKAPATVVPVVPKVKPVKEDIDEEPRRKRRRREEREDEREGTKSKSSLGCILVGVLGLFVVLAFGGVAAVVVYFAIRGPSDAAKTDKEWVEFVDPDKRFSVLMPGVPTTSEQRDEALRQNIKVYKVDLGSMLFLATYRDIPRGELAKMPMDQRFLNARQGMLKDITGSTFLYEKPATYENHPTRNIVLGLKPRGQVVTRVIFVDNRMFWLRVAGETLNPSSQDMAKFFDSFKVIEQTDKIAPPVTPYWDEQKLTRDYLSDMEEIDPKVGRGKFGKNGKLGYPDPTFRFSVAGISYQKGISIHPFARRESSVTYRLAANAKSFHTRTAIADDPSELQKVLPHSAAEFRVIGDGKRLWTSAPLRKPGLGEECKIDVENVQSLELQVYCDGASHGVYAVWLDPFVLNGER